jgi:hypothetical protein
MRRDRDRRLSNFSQYEAAYMRRSKRFREYNAFIVVGQRLDIHIFQHWKFSIYRPDHFL